ncbi:MAG: hypothetical protein KGP28_09715, partial [Bdellovibrionales bacterium]|nr:hypothetical protein [Bdellovibrionales bacterium]
IRSIGKPECSSNPKDHIRNANLMFRAVEFIPEPDSVASISATLKLRKMVRHSKLGDPSVTSLDGQVLCLYDHKGLIQPICSGKIAEADAVIRNKVHVVTDAFSRQALLSQESTQTGLLHFNGKDRDSKEIYDVEYDLKDLFDLHGLTVEEFVTWLRDHSVQYSENGYYKFRFAMGKNVYFESGHLILTTTLKDGKVPNQEAPVELQYNGDQDSVAHEFSDGTCQESSVSSAPVVEKLVTKTVLLDRSRKTGGSTTYVNSPDDSKASAVGVVLGRYKAEIEKVEIEAGVNKAPNAEKASQTIREYIVRSSSLDSSVITAKGVTTHKNYKILVTLKGLPEAQANKVQQEISDGMNSAWK